MSDQVRVPAEGPVDANIVFIGEAPAKNEVYQGRPFVGSAGEKFDDLLALASLNRDEFYITNVSKVRAPGDKMSRMSYEDLTAWEIELIQEINSLKNPKILVPMGAYALRALTNKSQITAFRGSPLKPKSSIKHDCIVIPVLHPSLLHYHYEDWVLIVADFIKIRRIMKNGYKFEFPKYNFILKPSWSQVVETLEMLEKEQHELVVIDVETPNNCLSAIGLAWNREDAISIPLYMGDRSNYWSFEQELELWKLLAERLPKLNLGNQNVIFDWRVMEEHGVCLKMPTWDPMLMHHCLYSEMRHKLEIIISIYTNLPFYKRDEKEEKGSSIHPGKEMKHWEYNCMDCIGALWAIEELKEELIEEDMLDVYLDLYAEVIPPIFRMNMDGVAVDMPRLELVQKDLKALVKDYTAKIVEETGIEVNANSPKQVGALLYDSMNMDKYKGGDTAKKTLEKLAYKYKTEVPTMIIDIRAARKELGLFSEENIENGRVKTEYSLSRTNTGRFVSRKAFARGGMNLQNVKRGEQRKFFIAEPGHVLVSADQKQAEAMLVGWYAQDRNLIALFESGKSLHLENAYNLFGEHITKNDPRYIIAKGCIHGGNYGLGPWKFAYMTGLPFTDAKDHLENYHATYPGIRNTFHADVQRDIRNGRTLYNPFGRREVFLGRFNDETFRAGYAFKPQSTVSDINKKALKFIAKYYKPLLELHDGIIISVPESEIQDSIDAFCDAYDIHFKVHDEEHTIPIEITCGPNWEDQTVIY